MYNNQMYPNGYGTAQNGFNYSTPRPSARNTQPLTTEQINKLRQDANTLDLKVEQEDLWRAACTHKEKNGDSALIVNQDGSVTCDICKTTFNMVDYSVAQVEGAVKIILDILQTSKTIWVNAPEGVIVQYFQMIVLLEKIAKIWKRSMDDFNRFEPQVLQSNGVNSFNPGMNSFSALGQLMSQPLMNPYMSAAPQPGYYQQPNPYAGQVAPMPGYAQQPAPAPVYPQPMDASNNPMAYGAPGVQPGYYQQPVQAPAPGVIPGAPQPVPAPAAPAPVPQPQATDPAAGQEVQQQQTFNV